MPTVSRAIRKQNVRNGSYGADMRDPLDTTIDEPSFDADEATHLLFSVDRSRAQFAWKAGGLTADQLHLRAVPTSALTLGRWDVAGVAAFYAAFVASWGMLGRHLGLGGAYFAGLAVAAAQALWHLGLIRDRSREGCFRAFRLNHWVGFAIFAGLVSRVPTEDELAYWTQQFEQRAGTDPLVATLIESPEYLRAAA